MTDKQKFTDSPPPSKAMGKFAPQESIAPIRDSSRPPQVVQQLALARRRLAVS
jgi:hypothetical protein